MTPEILPIQKTRPAMRFLAFLLIAFIATSNVALAQIPDPFSIIAGQPAVSMFCFDHTSDSLHFKYLKGIVGATSKDVYIISADYEVHDLFSIPDDEDLTIVSVKEKFSLDVQDQEELLVIITLSNGSGAIGIWDLQYNTINYDDYLPPYIFGQIKETIGDALYQLNGNEISKSIDTGRTWTIDTSGLNGNYVNDIALDSAQNVYAAGNTTLFKQALNGSIWTAITCPLTQITAIYVDSKDRIWAAGSVPGHYALYVSPDMGTTWNIDSAGIAGMNVKSIGGDKQGNIFVVVNTAYFYNTGDQLFSSAGGTAPFVRIDQGVRQYNASPADSGIFMSVYGDSDAIVTSTTLGLFSSPDGGATWSPVRGIASRNVYGLVQADNGALLITNSIGCFSHISGDTVWNKKYPTNGYYGGQPILRDATGNIYTMGAPIGQGLPHLVVKSTDNGATWNPDTAGISTINLYNWWVDEAGNQYGGNIYGGGPGQMMTYKKPAGGSWTADTAGITSSQTYDQSYAFGSDGNGTIYHSIYSGKIFSRPVNGSSWTADSGIGGDWIATLAHMANHTMIAGGNSNLHYKTSGGTWQNMPVNTPAPSGTSPYAVAVDDSDYVWAAFSHQGGSGNYTGDGVFYTKDMGHTWLAADGNIASVTFRLLVPVGDSVFGITYFNGVFVFKHSTGNTGIVQPIAAKDNLYLFPNPATTECNAIFTVPQNTRSSQLAIYDVTGKSLKQIVLPISANQVSFKTDGLDAGIYFCSLIADGKVVETRKLEVGK